MRNDDTGNGKEQRTNTASDGFFPKHEYVYDEYYDCYICPNNEVLNSSATNRDGSREYKSCGAVCARCPCLAQCANSRDHVRTVTRHVWADALEEAEENRYTYGIREYYKLRKETIERDFALAKELHGFRCTQECGKARMEWKAALTCACMNLKKLARKRWKGNGKDRFFRVIFSYLQGFFRHDTKLPSAA